MVLLNTSQTNSSSNHLFGSATTDPVQFKRGFEEGL